MSREQRMRPISRHVIDRIRQARQTRGMSVQQLADAITNRGYPIRRNTLADMETHRIAAVPVDVAVLAAQALAVPVARLLPPPPDCRTCKGRPPAGFTCNRCGARQPEMTIHVHPDPPHAAEAIRDVRRNGGPLARRSTPR